MDSTRRQLLSVLGLSGAGLLIDGIARGQGEASEEDEDKEEAGKEVTAVEDLMREHGILRRALFVYSETAALLRRDASSVPPDALQRTAALFRSFGEDYHEKKLEEAYIFPAVKKAGGPAAVLPDVLVAQHKRGREITDYLLSTTKGPKLDVANPEPLASAMESFVRMYRPHAAREDTVVFPAWKQALSAEQLDEMGEKFEEIEHEQFGEDGFEKAVRQISEIENHLGLADLALFTAPLPIR
jgi:hemerythrin-like domain-containing protein